ncbi:MAG: hypothetical protein QOE73_460, partial [Verrucomicrobiota bacterium]
ARDRRAIGSESRHAPSGRAEDELYAAGTVAIRGHKVLYNPGIVRDSRPNGQYERRARRDRERARARVERDAVYCGVC